MVAYVTPWLGAGLTSGAPGVSKVRFTFNPQLLHSDHFFRACVPEEYGVRKIIHATLKSYASMVTCSISHPSGSSSSSPNHDARLSRTAEGLQKLI